MSATVHATEVTPPERRPTWPRWRPAMRLAIRDARHDRARTLMVVALVALPVSVLLGVYFYADCYARGELLGPQRALGSVAAGSLQEERPSSQRLPASMTNGWRLVPWPLLTAVVGNSGQGAEAVGGTAGDVSDPVIAGLVQVSSGRLPANDTEVLVGAGLSRTMGKGIGDDWALDLGAGLGQARQQARIVGIGRMAGDNPDNAFLLGAVPGQWPNAYPPVGPAIWERPKWNAGPRYLIDSATPITDADVATALTAGLLLVGRGTTPSANGPGSGPYPDGTFLLGLGIGLLQVVILAGGAFAVSVRRRQRELALLAAAGAEPGDLTRAVLASGIVLGGIGACGGAVLAWLVVVLGRPVWQATLAHEVTLAAFPSLQLALVLVPAVAWLAAIFASCLPALLAARIPIAAALRARDSGGMPDSVGQAGRPPRWLPWVAGLMLTGGLACFAIAAGTASDLEGPSTALLMVGFVGCELGVLGLAPALVSGFSRVPGLPVALRIPVRDGARNWYRTSVAGGAIAASVGVLAGVHTFAVSMAAAVTQGGTPFAAPGVSLIRNWEAPDSRWAQSQAQSLEARFPGVAAYPIATDSVQLVSACLPEELGGQRVAPMDVAAYLQSADYSQAAALVLALPADSPCRAPRRLGDAFGGSALGWNGAGVNVLVADPDAAAALLGQHAPVIRRALDGGGAVALDPRARYQGELLLAEVVRGVPARTPTTRLAAGLVESAVRPAGAIVSPKAMADAGIPVTYNAVVVRWPSGSPTQSQLDALWEANSAGYGVWTSADSSQAGVNYVGWPGTPPAWWSWGLALFALLAAGLAAALAGSESRRDLRIVAAVGGTPRDLRVLTAGSAGLAAAMGSLLGAVLGVVGGWAVLVATRVFTDPEQCAWWSDPTSEEVWRAHGDVCPVLYAPDLTIPWAWLGLVVVGLPVVLAAVFAVLPVRGATRGPRSAHPPAAIHP